LLFRIATYIFVLFRSQEKIPAIQALPEEFHFRSGYKVQANFCVVTEWVPIGSEETITLAVRSEELGCETSCGFNSLQPH